MSTSPAPIRSVGVTVIDGALHVRDLVEPDSEVVRVVGEADDPVRGDAPVPAHRRPGGAATNAAVDVEFVERSFDTLAHRLDDQVTGAVEQIGTVADQLLGDESGALTATLAGFHEQLDGLLGSTSIPTRRPA